MKLIKTGFKDLVIIKTTNYSDNRGFFKEVYKEKLKKKKFIFDCMSVSKKNVIRGLHLQTKNPQGKLITVTKGEIFDVAVDLRKKSKTYGKVFKKIINSKNSMGILIPNGFAHGLIALENNTILINFSSNDYKPDKEFGINIKSMNFKLPRIKMLFSKKDKKLISLKDFLKNNK